MRFFARILVLIVPILGLSGFGSCGGNTPTALCKRALPQFNQDVEDALLAMAPWLEGPGRAIASVDAGIVPAASSEGAAAVGADHSTDAPGGPRAPRSEDMAERDRENWARWAQERLVSVQRQLDVVREAPSNPAVQELSRVAIRLVAFHGYAELGDVARMNETLLQIREGARKAAQEYCLLPEK